MTRASAETGFIVLIGILYSRKCRFLPNNNNHQEKKKRIVASVIIDKSKCWNWFDTELNVQIQTNSIKIWEKIRLRLLTKKTKSVLFSKVLFKHRTGGLLKNILLENQQWTIFWVDQHVYMSLQSMFELLFFQMSMNYVKHSKVKIQQVHNLLLFAKEVNFAWICCACNN